VVRWQLNSDWISKIKRTKRRKRDEKDEFGSFATCVFGGHGLFPDNGSISYRQQYGHILRCRASVYAGVGWLPLLPVRVQAQVGMVRRLRL